MTEDTPRGTRSRLGPNAAEGMPDESEQPEARRKIADEAEAQTAERDQPSPTDQDDEKGEY